jgi:outer membrane protein
MKRLKFLRASLGALSIATASLCMATSLHAAEANSPSTSSDKPVKIGVVNFKLAVEDSKAGKLEQGNFENLKKQMESVLEEKEKGLTEIAAKFNDPDYLDSLSAEAENELKHKFRTMNQDLTQIQSQYYQTLNQANMKILQKLNDVVAEAATKVAKEKGYDLIVNDDSIYFSRGGLDITKSVIDTMNTQFDKDQKENKYTPASLK